MQTWGGGAHLHLRQDREMDGVESGTGTVWPPGAPVSLNLIAKAVNEEHVARMWQGDQLG